MGFPLDVRHYYKAVADYCCWKAGKYRTNWKMLVEASMRRLAIPLGSGKPRTRAKTQTQEQEILRELHAKQLPAEELEAEWKNRTENSLETCCRHRPAMRLS